MPAHSNPLPSKVSSSIYNLHSPSHWLVLQLNQVGVTFSTIWTVGIWAVGWSPSRSSWCQTYRYLVQQWRRLFIIKPNSIVYTLCSAKIVAWKVLTDCKCNYLSGGDEIDEEMQIHTELEVPYIVPSVFRRWPNCSPRPGNQWLHCHVSDALPFGRDAFTSQIWLCLHSYYRSSMRYGVSMPELGNNNSSNSFTLPFKRSLSALLKSADS